MQKLLGEPGDDYRATFTAKEGTKLRTVGPHHFTGPSGIDAEKYRDCLFRQAPSPRDYRNKPSYLVAVWDHETVLFCNASLECMQIHKKHLIGYPYAFDRLEAEMNN